MFPISFQALLCGISSYFEPLHSDPIAAQEAGYVSLVTNSYNDLLPVPNSLQPFFEMPGTN